MKVELLKPDAILYSGEAEAISLPGVDGRFQILNNHAAMVSSLKAGEVVIETTDNKKEVFNIEGGILEILNNKAIILA